MTTSDKLDTITLIIFFPMLSRYYDMISEEVKFFDTSQRDALLS